MSNTKPNITDLYADVLEVLTPQARRGLIAELASAFTKAGDLAAAKSPISSPSNWGA